MAASIRHRKLIEPSPNATTFFSLCPIECDPLQNPTRICSHDCTLFCPSYCLPTSSSPTPSPATSPHPFPPPSDHHHHPPLSLPLKISLIFLFTTVIYTLYKFYTIWHRSRPRPTPPSPENQETQDYAYGYNDGVVEHPIWYIRTAGLQPSVINGLKVVKFSKFDGTIVEGTDCSVCLTEFEEGDMLRLLPNCKHAFHVPCIDTWLRSHTNCPLCRAVIVSNSVDATSSEGNNDGLGFTGDTNLGVLSSDRGEASGSSGIRVRETEEDHINNSCLKIEG